MQLTPSNTAEETATRPVRIQVDTGRALIEVTWKGYVPGATYRQVLEEARQRVQDEQLRYWLADLRDMGAILRPDELWTTQDWFPRLGLTGLRRMAILSSSDYFNRMSVERIMDASTPRLSFEVAWFDDRDDALAWLLSTAPPVQAT